jgi:pSer/pThr/pTyr-binding forkhead associated (FHA) protein
MDANLVTLSGASQGITFTLTEDFTYIGRGRGNHISLQDPSTSRNHCVINKQQDVYVIKDLDSTNGIRVNGTPVREATLQHEDRIEVGDSVFIFLIVKAETSDEKIETSDSTNIVSARPSIKLRSEEVIYLEPEKMLTRYPLTSRIAKGLDALIKITAAIQSILSSQLLAAKVLELISDAVPAERGAILWRNNESEWEMISKFSRSSTETFRVCQDVVEQVVTVNVGFVSNEIQNDQTLKQSHEAKEVHSLLAVPIMCNFLNSFPS